MQTFLKFAKSSCIWDHLEDVGLPELVLIAAWHIWWERRQCVRIGHVQPPHRSAMPIGSLWRIMNVRGRKV